MANLTTEDGHSADTNSRYNQKRPPNSFISKSLILPTNAFHLHLEDPSVTLTTPHDPVHPSHTDAPPNHLRPNARVRFRSRVRITSGIGHKRKGDSAYSSRSGSPSSSISAPLRYHANEENNGWGTLGQRVGILGLQKKTNGSPERARRQRRKRADPIAPAESVDERAPLRGSFYRSYTEGEGAQEEDILDEDSDDERLSQEIDDVFGTFPGRLLNYHVSHTDANVFYLPLSLVVVLVVSNGTYFLLSLCCRY